MPPSIGVPLRPPWTSLCVLWAREETGRRTLGVRGFCPPEPVVIARGNPSACCLGLERAELLPYEPDSQGRGEPGRLLNYSPPCFLGLTIEHGLAGLGQEWASPRPQRALGESLSSQAQEEGPPRGETQDPVAGQGRGLLPWAFGRR